VEHPHPTIVVEEALHRPGDVIDVGGGAEDQNIRFIHRLADRLQFRIMRAEGLAFVEAGGAA
jgi:hypothetical protein